jgi:hypothetical protein
MEVDQVASQHNGKSAAPIRVLFLGGVGRSGSTLLDRMLGQLPQCWPLGEMSVLLWDRCIGKDWPCGCGQPFGECPFWREVGQRAFGGWDQVPIDEVLGLQAAVDDSRYVPLLASPWQPRAFAAKLNRYTDLLSRLYHAVATVSGARLLVDSGKHPSSAYVLRRVPGIDLAVVHLVRDPRGVAYSWNKTKEQQQSSSHAAQPPLARFPIRTSARRYLTWNAMVEGLSALGTPVVRMRYEDLMRHPRQEIARLAPLLPVPPDESALQFLGDDVVDLAPNHICVGNPNRFQVGQVPLRLDDAWRSKMPEEDRRQVERITLPMRLRYGYR